MPSNTNKPRPIAEWTCSSIRTLARVTLWITNFMATWQVPTAELHHICCSTREPFAWLRAPHLFARTGVSLAGGVNRTASSKHDACGSLRLPAPSCLLLRLVRTCLCGRIYAAIVQASPMALRPHPNEIVRPHGFAEAFCPTSVHWSYLRSQELAQRKVPHNPVPAQTGAPGKSAGGIVCSERPRIKFTPSIKRPCLALLSSRLDALPIGPPALRSEAPFKRVWLASRPNTLPSFADAAASDSAPGTGLHPPPKPPALGHSRADWELRAMATVYKAQLKAQPFKCEHPSSPRPACRAGSSVPKSRLAAL